MVDSSPMYGAAEEVIGDLAREAGRARRSSSRDQGLDDAGSAKASRRWRPRCGSCARAPRPDAGAQPGRRRHAPRDAARSGSGRGASATSASRTTRERPRRSGALHRAAAGRLPADQLLGRRARGGAAPAARSRASRRGRPRQPPVRARRLLFRDSRGKPLPEWATEIGCTSWAQLLLKFVISHPAVTCAIPATVEGGAPARQHEGRGGACRTTS